MNTIAKTLGRIAGGSMLDVATQAGGFVQILMENLRNFTEIVGIDIDAHSIATARDILWQDSIRFFVTNAEQIDFDDECFDTVSISAALHHLERIPHFLGEMNRVLKPGGHFIIVEMHRDGQIEAELTSVYLQHWVAEVDSALGHLHNSILSRQNFVDYAEGLKLCNIECHDFSDTDSDPLDKARIEREERRCVINFTHWGRKGNQSFLSFAENNENHCDNQNSIS